MTDVILLNGYRSDVKESNPIFFPQAFRTKALKSYLLLKKPEKKRQLKDMQSAISTASCAYCVGLRNDIPRKEYKIESISASRVRKLLEKGRVKEL